MVRSKELGNADPFGTSYAKQLSIWGVKQTTISFVDLRHREIASKSISSLSKPGQNTKEDIPAMSEEEGQMTPCPKRSTAERAQVIDDDISSELINTDDPDWEMSPGKNDEGRLNKLNNTDLSTAEEDDTLGDETHAPDLEERPLPVQQKNKATSSKSSKKKNADKGKGKTKVRDAILQARTRKPPVVSLICDKSVDDAADDIIFRSNLFNQPPTTSKVFFP